MNILFNKIKSLYSGKARRQIQNKKMLSIENASERFEHIYKKDFGVVKSQSAVRAQH